MAVQVEDGVPSFNPWQTQEEGVCEVGSVGDEGDGVPVEQYVP